MRRAGAAALALAAAVAAAGCPEAATCPAAAPQALGSYVLTYQLQEGSDACRITRQSDGGPADASLAVALPQQALTVCGGASDGGVTLALAVGTGPYRTTQQDAGGFSLEAAAGNLQGSACICPLDQREVFTGLVAGEDGGPLGAAPDGGLLPLARTFAGALTSRLSATAGGGGCACNLPCTIRYAVTGAR